MSVVRPNIDAVVFDFYKTLVDVDKDVPSAAMTLVALGFQCPPELEAMWMSDAFDGQETPSFFSRPDYSSWRRNNFRSLCKMAGVPGDRVDELSEHLLALDATWTVRSIDGAADAITGALTAGLKVGICSNWDYDISSYVNQAQLPLVTAFISSAEVGVRKPNSKIFLAISERLGTSPERICFVGDSWHTDIVGALRCGMLPVWISNGRHNPIPNQVLSINILREWNFKLFADRCAAVK